MANDSKKIEILRVDNRNQIVSDRTFKVKDYTDEIEIRLRVKDYEQYSDKYNFVWTFNGKYYIKTKQGSALIIAKKNYRRSFEIGVILEEISEDKKAISSTIVGQGSIEFKVDGPILITNIQWLDNEYKEKNTFFCGEYGFVYITVKGLFEGEKLDAEILLDGQHFSTFQSGDYAYKYNEVNASEIYYKFHFSASFADRVKKEGSILKIVFDPKWIKKGLKIGQNCTQEITILPSEFKTIDKAEHAAVTVTAVTGSLDVVDNNHKPCRFSSLVMSHQLYPNDDPYEMSEDTVVFDETKSVDIAIYPVVSGNKGRQVHIIQKSLSYKECEERTLKHLQRSKNLKIKEALSIPWDIDENNNFIYKSIDPMYIDASESLIKVPISYNYFITDQILPIHCIWPLWKTITQTYKIPLETCRHQKDVIIDVYPDVQWKIGFKMKMEKVDKPAKGKRGFKWESFFVFGYKCNDLGVKVAEKPSMFTESKYATNEEISVTISSDKSFSLDDFDLKKASKNIGKFLANYANEKIVMKIRSIADTVDFLFSIFDELKQLADTTTVISNDNENFNIEARLKKVDWKPIYPDFDIDLIWRATTTKQTPGIILVGGASGIVVGGKIIFDMFAIAGANAYIKAFIFAVDFIANNILDTRLVFNLVISGTLKFNTQLSYNSSNGETDSRVQLIGELKLLVELSATIEKAESATLETKTKGPNHTYTEKQTESEKKSTKYAAEGSGAINARIDIGSEEDGMYASFNVINGAVEVAVFSEQQDRQDNKSETNRKKNKDKKRESNKREQEKSDEEKPLRDKMNNPTSDSTNIKAKNIYYQDILIPAGAWKMFEKDEVPKVKLW